MCNPTRNFQSNKIEPRYITTGGHHFRQFQLASMVLHNKIPPNFSFWSFLLEGLTLVILLKGTDHRHVCHFMVWYVQEKFRKYKPIIPSLLLNCIIFMVQISQQGFSFLGYSKSLCCIICWESICFGWGRKGFVCTEKISICYYWVIWMKTVKFFEEAGWSSGTFSISLFPHSFSFKSICRYFFYFIQRLEDIVV